MACYACGLVDWGNPTPVVVCLQPTTFDEMIVVRRNIEPQKGKLCLPGGFIDEGENLWDAATRELMEETGFMQKAWKFLDAFMTEHNHLVLFVEGAIPLSFGDRGEPSTPEEVSEVTAVSHPIELAFESHTEMLVDWFSPT